MLESCYWTSPRIGWNKKNRREWLYWEEIRNYGFGELSNLNALIITHDKDNYNSPKDYSMFENHNEVKFVNLTSSKCKKKAALGGFHGIALTKCFANEDPRSKEIAKYLEEIF